jgi:hypothetical protein
MTLRLGETFLFTGGAKNKKVIIFRFKNNLLELRLFFVGVFYFGIVFDGCSMV